MKCWVMIKVIPGKVYTPKSGELPTYRAASFLNRVATTNERRAVSVRYAHQPVITMDYWPSNIYIEEFYD